jgi:hypothetical protein
MSNDLTRSVSAPPLYISLNARPQHGQHLALAARCIAQSPFFPSSTTTCRLFGWVCRANPKHTRSMWCCFRFLGAAVCRPSVSCIIRQSGLYPKLEYGGMYGKMSSKVELVAGASFRSVWDAAPSDLTRVPREYARAVLVSRR